VTRTTPRFAATLTDVVTMAMPIPATVLCLALLDVHAKHLIATAPKAELTHVVEERRGPGGDPVHNGRLSPKFHYYRDRRRRRRGTENPLSWSQWVNQLLT
jgi:hypothetical protein